MAKGGGGMGEFLEGAVVGAIANIVVGFLLGGAIGTFIGGRSS